MGQLKSLFASGEWSTCEDLIDLIISEQHDLIEDPQLFLLGAQVEFFKSEDIQKCCPWVKQAALNDPAHPEVIEWVRLLEAYQWLSEGDYQRGQRALQTLTYASVVESEARFILAHHLFWKNIDGARAIDLLEEVVLDHPNMNKAWACLGFAYNRSGFRSKAQEAFGICLQNETDPDKVALYKQQLAS
ncbi:MAG: hypothetical protein KDD33_05595 [Bdellovibrionales bacterium]|nr:hypothetical protein [Bdellovibrionales bacterium]